MLQAVKDINGRKPNDEPFITSTGQTPSGCVLQPEDAFPGKW